MIFDRIDRQKQWRAIRSAQYPDDVAFWRGWKLIVLVIVAYVLTHVAVTFVRWNW